VLHQRQINRLALAVCGALLLVAGARADDLVSGAAAPQPVALDVTIKKGELVGTEQIQRALITVGTNQFMIVAPGDARVSVPTPDRVTFIPTDYHYYLSFRVLNVAEAPPDTLTADFYRGQLQSQYPGASIVTESSEMALNHSGPAFDLRWTTAAGEVELVRVAYIPCRAGVLEFSLLVDRKKNNEAQCNFRGLLITCRSNENGKIEIVPFPSAS
jgi:hypothetical protein